MQGYPARSRTIRRENSVTDFDTQMREAQRSGRTALPEAASKAVLSAYGIAVPRSTSFATPDDAGDAIGYGDLVGEVFGVFDAVGSVMLQSQNGARIGVNGREFANLRDGWSGDIAGTAEAWSAGWQDRSRKTGLRGVIQ